MDDGTTAEKLADRIARQTNDLVRLRGQPISSREQDMNQAKLRWLDRLLIKIAVAKAVARGASALDTPALARSLKEAFAVTREP